MYRAHWKVELTEAGLSDLLSTGIGHVASTIAAIIGLLYLFLGSGDTFLRKLVSATPSLKDKKRAVEIVRNIEVDISSYLLMVASINIAIGFIVTATTGVLGISEPFLWGTLAAVLSFAPYVGEFAIVILLSLAGLLTFDNLVQALAAPTVYFVLMTICWQGVVPFVVGRRMILSPVVSCSAGCGESSVLWLPYRCPPASRLSANVSGRCIRLHSS